MVRTYLVFHKAIAVLTTAFLPATFFAAHFPIPSLGWDDPDEFALYWGYVIPLPFSHSPSGLSS